MDCEGGTETVMTGQPIHVSVQQSRVQGRHCSPFGFGFPPGMGQVVRVDVNAPPTHPSAAPPLKPAKLPTTGGTDFPWLALALAALTLLCAGWWLRRARARGV